MIYGYARISTKKQIDGNSLENQRELLKKFGAEQIFEDTFTGFSKNRPELDKLFSILKNGDTLICAKLDRIELLKKFGAEQIFEDTFTGFSKNRPELDKLFSILKNGDTLICAKLDRIARSILHGKQIIEELKQKGIRVHIIEFGGVLDDTPTGRLMLNMFFSIAEFERDLILERTQIGKEIASRVHIIEFGGVLDDTPTGRLMLNMFFSIAEFERDLILERTQIGKEIARTKNGYREGRPPKFTKTQLDYAMKLLENHTYKEVEKMMKISVRTLYRESAKRKV